MPVCYFYYCMSLLISSCWMGGWIATGASDKRYNWLRQSKDSFKKKNKCVFLALFNKLILKKAPIASCAFARNQDQVCEGCSCASMLSMLDCFVFFSSFSEHLGSCPGPIPSRKQLVCFFCKGSSMQSDFGPCSSSKMMLSFNMRRGG